MYSGKFKKIIISFAFIYTVKCEFTEGSLRTSKFLSRLITYSGTDFPVEWHSIIFALLSMIRFNWHYDTYLTVLIFWSFSDSVDILILLELLVCRVISTLIWDENTHYTFKMTKIYNWKKTFLIVYLVNDIVLNFPLLKIHSSNLYSKLFWSL